MTPALTLEPLSRAHLPEAAALWADPAVIRWTNIAAPCTAAEAVAHWFPRLRERIRWSSPSCGRPAGYSGR